MLRRIHTICAFLIIALGAVHIGLTGATYGEWLTGRALFFIGAGVAIILLGLVNIILLRAASDHVVRAICIGATAAGAALFGVGCIALPMPQVYALFGLMLLELGIGFAITRG